MLLGFTFNRIHPHWFISSLQKPNLFWMFSSCDVVYQKEWHYYLFSKCEAHYSSETCHEACCYLRQQHFLQQLKPKYLQTSRPENRALPISLLTNAKQATVCRLAFLQVSWGQGSNLAGLFLLPCCLIVSLPSITGNPILVNPSSCSAAETTSYSACCILQGEFRAFVPLPRGKLALAH